MRIALFGGTFDPIHTGHLTIAREAVRQFGLARVWFIPASRPPHKSGVVRTAYQHRLRMVEIACASEPLLEASQLEAGVQNSYSIETIEKVRASRGVQDELYFLIGADAFAEIRTWHRWREVVHSIDFIVVNRPGCAYQAPEGARVRPLEGLDLPVSSSEIRRRLAAGDEHVDVPAAVLAYIRQHGLYGVKPSGAEACQRP